MEVLQEYAQLLVSVGLNVQPGQKVVISAPLSAARLARLCVDAAYDRGASRVFMDWSDDYVTRATYLRAAEPTFEQVTPGRDTFLNTMAQEGAGFLHLSATDPSLMEGVNTQRILKAQQVSGKALKPYRDATMGNHVPWCIAALPCESWAKKVFPTLDVDKAMAHLWEAILATVRVTGDGSAVDAWQRHLDTLSRRCEQMNAYRFRQLHYTAQGTDLTVMLPETHLWEGGSDTLPSGIPFVANMPTEEIFTTPLKQGTQGVVRAVMPLVLNGVVVEGLSLRFENGRVVEATASTGQDALDTLLAVDDGARYLGEVALVSHDSPIKKTGLLFYHTLFDENASCHLALGDAYPCVENGASLSRQALTALGINESMIHEDFMVGSDDLSVTGLTADGTTVPLMVDGKMVL